MISILRIFRLSSLGLFYLICILTACAVGPNQLVPIDYDYEQGEILKDVSYLASSKTAGRLTSTPGEEAAAQFVARQFETIGLSKASTDNQSYIEPFSFFSGVSLGSNNALTITRNNQKPRNYELYKDWLPVALSRAGKFNSASVVFAGYGIVFPPGESTKYNSYEGLDVKDKWVLMFRFYPDKTPDKLKHLFSTYSTIQYKTMLAEERGALGIILVSGPNIISENKLISVTPNSIMGQSSIGVISASDNLASYLLGDNPYILKNLQDTLDSGFHRPGFHIQGVTTTSNISFNLERKTGHNVLGRLKASDPCEVVIVGAHFDHLGGAFHPASLERNPNPNQILLGANDNASGVAVMLGTARTLANLTERRRLSLKRDIVFAAWSGGETGLLGSYQFLDDWPRRQDPILHCTPKIAGYLNLDMVGQMMERIIIEGTSSSPWWRKQLLASNALLNLPLKLRTSQGIMTDSLSFSRHSIPAINIWTGSFPEYHTSLDTVDKLKIESMTAVLTLTVELTRRLSQTAKIS